MNEAAEKFKAQANEQFKNANYEAAIELYNKEGYSTAKTIYFNH